jgi:hypothetical protein
VISDYIAGELPPTKAQEVAWRLERDAAFRDIAEPLLMAWSVQPTARPLSDAELLSAWHEVRRRAHLPPPGMDAAGDVLKPPPGPGA